jgi:hypothetical protein
MACVAIDVAVRGRFQILMAWRSDNRVRSTCLKELSSDRSMQQEVCTAISVSERARYKVAQTQVTPLKYRTGHTQPSLPKISYPHLAAYISTLDSVSCGAGVSMRSSIADLNYPRTVACKGSTGLRLRRSTPSIKPTAWQRAEASKHRAAYKADRLQWCEQ